MLKFIARILMYFGIKDYWKWKLDEDYIFEDEYFEGIEADCEWASIHNGELTINAGYAWNGCSPKKKFFDLIYFGTPDGVIDINTGKQKAYYASLVHDCLYQYQFIERKYADQLFYELLKEVEFAPAKIYYLAVKWFGRRFKPYKYN